jgi:hypothetical protein
MARARKSEGRGRTIGERVPHPGSKCFDELFDLSPVMYSRLSSLLFVKNRNDRRLDSLRYK